MVQTIRQRRPVPRLNPSLAREKFLEAARKNESKKEDKAGSENASSFSAENQAGFAFSILLQKADSKTMNVFQAFEACDAIQNRYTSGEDRGADKQIKQMATRVRHEIRKIFTQTVRSLGLGAAKPV